MLRELGPFSLEKRRLRITLMSINTWKESAKRTDSSVVLTSSTKRNGQKLEHKRFPLNIRKLFCALRVTKQRGRLPRQAVEWGSLEIFQSHLDIVLGTALGGPAGAGVAPADLQRSHQQPQPLCDSAVHQQKQFYNGTTSPHQELKKLHNLPLTVLWWDTGSKI